MKAPFLYDGDKPLNISAETIFTTVKAIVMAGKEEAFLKQAAEMKMTVPLTPEQVNFVKSFLFASKAHKSFSMAREVVTSATCPD